MRAGRFPYQESHKQWVPTLAALVATGMLFGCGGEAPDLAIEPDDTGPAISTAHSADPGLAVGPDSGDLYLSWVGGSEAEGWRIFLARSADGGTTWSPPVAVTSDTGLVHPHAEAAPRLVAGPGGRVAVLWSEGFTVEGRQWPATRMRFARSTDGGATWSAPLVLNDDSLATPISHTFQGMVWTGESTLTAAWLDERAGGVVSHQHVNHDSTPEPDATIYAVSSPDFGGTWEANRPLWGAVCPCCRVAMARTPSGSAVAAWRKHFPGNIRDVVLSRVDQVSAEPVRVHQDNWEYPGCPHTGPAVAVDSTGTAHVVWYTGKSGRAGVFLARPRPDGDTTVVTLLSGTTLPTAHPAVAVAAGTGSVAAWDLNRAGERWLSIALVPAGSTSPRVTEVAGSAGASYPQLAALPEGGVVLAWTEVAGDSTRVRVRKLMVR